MSTLNIGTFNVRGLKNDFKKETVLKDFRKHNLDILAIQETHITDKQHTTFNIDQEKYELFISECKDYHHGVGFLVHSKYQPTFHKISDRILVCNIYLQDKNRDRHLKFINVYAPTVQRTKQNPEETEKLYSDLNNLLKQNRHSTFVLGDFNAVIADGHIKYPENVGKYSKGKINENGYYLIDFLAQNNLYATNTFFEHKLSNISTWQSNYFPEYRKNPFRNQIDFIIGHKAWKSNNLD